MSSKLKIQNAASESPVIWFYGEIGWDFNADDFRRALSSVSDKATLELRINSPGGSYTEAIAMHTNLARRAGTTNVIVDGLAASGGSVVAMAGDTITMAQGSRMMIHEAHGATSGRASDFRKYADVLEAMNADLVGIYLKRWAGEESDLRAAIEAETWYSASEAVEAGLATAVSESLAVAAYVDPAKFAYINTPKELILPEGALPPTLEARKSIVDELYSESEELEPCDAK